MHYPDKINQNIKIWIFNGKKSLWAKIIFSVITKNSKWEISTKNLVTFKRSDGVKDKKLWYLGVHWKIPLLGKVHKKSI